MKRILIVWLMLAFAVTGSAAFADPTASTTETLVMIRHGEKTAIELGQLDERGLNRSLALTPVLVGKYGKPDFIFAPNPSVQVSKGAGSYSYIRPLATIEPTAIRLGMPVNTQIGYDQIQQLQTELTQPTYANSVVYIAWEHSLDQFAKNLMTAYGKDATVVPDWAGSDYNSIFVVRLVHTGTVTTATFTLDHEGLNDKLTDTNP